MSIPILWKWSVVLYNWIKYSTPVLGSDLGGRDGRVPAPPVLGSDLGGGRGGGTPRPPRNGEQSENITFRHPSDAGGKYFREVMWSVLEHSAD